MVRRQLLYLRPDEVTISPDLQEVRNDWDIHATSDLQQAVNWSKKKHLRVGIATLEGWGQPPTMFEDMLLATPEMKWIALLPTSALTQSGLASIIQYGFYDYHTLPLDLPRLRLMLGHAYGMAALNGHEPDNAPSYNEYAMIGTSPVMQNLFRLLNKVAAVDAPILIQGESGTGKELAALAIHRHSARAKLPFIAVNCGTLPGNLIQTELFGHERGAFTGAHQRKIGKLESAAGGSVFLDEIGDLSLDLQVTLLRFLQNRTIERVGGNEPIPVNVGIIAATHVDLEKAVLAGRFREDLFYRLNVLHLTVPSLRERGLDIEILARFFFNEFRGERNPRIKGFSREALETMTAYRWPGNVRELINRVRHALVMCEKYLITPTDLGLDRALRDDAQLTLIMARHVAERSIIETTLQRVDNNISETARQLNISRVTLYRLMQKYNVRI